MNSKLLFRPQPAKSQFLFYKRAYLRTLLKGLWMEQYSWRGLIQIDDGRTDRPTSLAHYSYEVEEEAGLSRWWLIGEAVHLCEFNLEEENLRIIAG